ncbi:MAG: helix-hairpin-helix domain-containing protein, partial [Longimicrobiales bacterium]
ADHHRPEGDPLVGRGDHAAALLAASREVDADDARRGRPLEPGERIDANRAPEAELDRLPGVGPAVAAAWVAHRESHGGFAGPDDLTAIRGVGPATAARLAPLLQFSAPPPMLLRRKESAVRRGSAPARGSPAVDLNTADSAALMGLPGIGPALAGRILARRRRSRFTSVDDLLEVRGIGPATLERLRAEVVVGRRCRGVGTRNDGLASTEEPSLRLKYCEQNGC